MMACVSLAIPNLADWPPDVRLLRAAERVLARVDVVISARSAERVLLRDEMLELEAAALELSAQLGNFCRICGCTQDAACEGGCSWVDDDLCSSHRELIEQPPGVPAP